MSEANDPGSLDFVLQWKEQGQRARSGADRVSVQLDAAPAEEQQLESSEGTAPEESPELYDEALSASVAGTADDAELFEWSADREQAIFDALREMPQGAVPRVHAQLDAIARGLESGKLEKAYALGLLGEVDEYLAARIAAEECKTPVAHDAFIASRADKLNALYAWAESAAALREFIETGEQVHLKVAAYAADQGHAYLTGSREVLLAADPEA